MSALALTLKTSATLKHFNPRKEGDEDDSELAADLKFHAEGVSASVLTQLLPTDAGHDPVTAFWDDDGHPRWFGFGELGIGVAFESHEVTLGRLQPLTAKVHKFAFTIRDERRIDLTFTVQCHPRAAAFTSFAEWLHEAMDVGIRPTQHSLDLVAPASSERRDHDATTVEVRLDGPDGKTVFKGTAAEFSETTARITRASKLAKRIMLAFVDDTHVTAGMLVERLNIGAGNALTAMNMLERMKLIGPRDDHGRHAVLSRVPTTSRNDATRLEAAAERFDQQGANEAWSGDDETAP